MLTVKASHLVKPAVKTPSGYMYLPENDQFMPITHVTIIYIYKSQTVSDLSLSLITHILKTSLSKTLTIFHPLAGRLHLPSQSSRFQLNLNSAGALLLEAESTKKLEDLGDFCPTPEIEQLIPSVDYTRPIHDIPLLIVQITKFKCGAVSLGLGFQHTVVDGRAIIHFMSEWARISRGESPEYLPFLDRTVLNVGDDDEIKPGFELGRPPVLIDGPGPDEERVKETTVVLLKLTKDQIAKLKKTANQNQQKTGYDKGQPFTRYEVVAAHMWRCMSIARRLNNEQITRLRMQMEFRHQIDPPLPDKYFGNAMLIVTTDVTMKNLLLQGLGYVAGKVREGISKGTNEYVRSFLAHLRKIEDFNKVRYFHIVGTKQGDFQGNPNVSITSWIGLTNDGKDFGWGKEIYMGPGLVGFDGKAFVFPRFADDDGSLMVALRLQKTHIDEFMKLFYENLSNMSRL
ncbi:spermidine hydroxycinnamoyl transferase-like [Impatiens glandulifera]|uniref:spermidine hydroxycinnamoyl transferase-like n=1 Tax=Impatiens glandulifera TaxID=253017 RepID=UPI001FB1616A|nr:spermidine hydroxycinnamoyl transferase-like [Impatiens glandulifera]